MTAADNSLPPATSRRELRERERAALTAPPLPASTTSFVMPAEASLSLAASIAPTHAQAPFALSPSAEAPAVPLAATPAETFVASIASPDAPTFDATSAADQAPSRRRRLTLPQRSAPAARLVHEPRGTVRRPIGSRLLSGTAMLFAGGLLVGTTLPANALDVFTTSTAADTSLLAAAAPMQAQSIEISEAVGEVIAERDSFEVKSWAQVLRDRYGTRGSYTYTVGGTGPVRWPFPYFVPISSGYGERAAPCRGCSTTHNAIDLTPGAGAPIYAIADGVVIRREPRGGSWGNNLTIEHKINGQTVTSSYAHMQWDSSPIELGDVLKVGDFIGLVGATGQVTGAHLHFEIKVNGNYVNPYDWLKTNAG